jgi:hypothetical protein
MSPEAREWLKTKTGQKYRTADSGPGEYETAGDYADYIKAVGLFGGPALTYRGVQQDPIRPTGIQAGGYAGELEPPENINISGSNLIGEVPRDESQYDKETKTPIAVAPPQRPIAGIPMTAQPVDVKPVSQEKKKPPFDLEVKWDALVADIREKTGAGKDPKAQRSALNQALNSIGYGIDVAGDLAAQLFGKGVETLNSIFRTKPLKQKNK